jgi:hypothetical protein
MIGDFPIRPPRRGSNNFRNNISNNDHPSDSLRSPRGAQRLLSNAPKPSFSDRAWCTGMHAVPLRFVPRVCVQASNFKVCALSDSGSTCSVIPFSLYDRLRQLRKVPPLKEFPTRCLRAISQPLNVVGQIRCKLRVDKYTWVVTFLVSDNLVCLLYSVLIS